MVCNRQQLMRSRHHSIQMFRSLRAGHLLQSMVLLSIASSNSHSTEDAESHAGLTHCMMPRQAADAKPCRHILGGAPMGFALYCCFQAGIYQAECCTCSLTSTSFRWAIADVAVAKGNTRGSLLWLIQNANCKYWPTML